MKRLLMLCAGLVFLIYLGCASGGGGGGVETGISGETREVTDEKGFDRQIGPAEMEYQSAQQFLASGDRADAIEHLRRATELKPTYLEAWSDLGKTLTAMEEYEQAIAALERALELSPNNVGLIGYLGRNYLFLENWEEAERYFRMLIAQDPTDHSGNINLGFIFMKLGRADSAIAYYEKAIAEKPDDATTLGSLANLYGDKGEREKKIEYLEKAIQAAPDNARFKTMLATEFFNHKEYERALPVYEDLVKSYPDMAAYWQRYGFALSQSARKAEAPQALEKAIELKGDDPFIFAILARIYNENGEYPKAIEKAKQGLALNAGQEAFLYYQWGEALSKLKQYDEAIAKFQKVISYKDETWTSPARKQIDRQEQLKKREEALKEKERWE